ncbi:MAG TPA: S9 family peptidase [Thermoanaerobaculia bacterium]
MKPLLLLLCALSLAAKRPLTVDDEFRIVEAANPLISPDGRWVLYSVTHASLADNARHSVIWIASTSDGVPPREFLKEGDGSPMWARDSRSVFFVRAGQLFEQRIDGGAAVQHSRLAGGERPWRWQLSRDGSFFLALQSEEKPDAPGAEGDVAFVDEGSNGQTRLAWDNVFRYDLKSETLVRVTERKWSIDDADLSPDGRSAVVAARPDNDRNTRWKTELYVVDLASGAARQLTHNAAPESTPVWSPDGTWILFNAVRLDTWELGNGDFWRVDAATGKTRLLTRNRAGRFSGTPVFSPDGRSIDSQSGYGTARFPVRVDAATGAIARLIETDGAARVGSWSEDRSTFAYTYEDAATPPDIYVGPRQHRVTDLNPWLRQEIALGSVQRVRWKSRDGLGIEGLLVLPPAEVAAKTPLPLIVHVACGPGCGWVNSFSAKNQVYAGLGYAQLSPNVRGSSNYDDAFMRANKFDIEVGDRHDLLDGADAMVARGIADPKKLGIDGWSYGAILAGYTITQTDRFKAASLGAMVSDWTTDYGSVAYYSTERWFIGGNPWTMPARWRERSSLTYANRVHTPALLHHGDDDRSCAPFQSMNFFVALRRFGRTARLIRYPGEGHDFVQPVHIRLRDQEDIDWMERYVRGIGR